MQALGVAAPDHHERGSGRVVVLVGRVAGEDLAPVAPGRVPGLVEREPVANGCGVRAQDLADAEGGLIGPAVLGLAIECAADEDGAGASHGDRIPVQIFIVRGGVGNELSFAHDPQCLIEVALVAARRHLAVHRHFAVGVDLGNDLVVDGIRNQRHAGDARPSEAEDAGGVVLDGHSLRLRDHRAVVALHAVRKAAVGRVVSLVAPAGVGGREVNQVHCTGGGERARADVERLPARARHLPRRVRQVQFIQAIGGGDLEFRAGIELPVDDVALPQVELDVLADVVERELDGRAKQVHVIRQIAHHAVGVAEGESRIVGLVPHALRDAIEVHQARQVQPSPDSAAPVGEINGWIAALEGLDLDERNHLLHLRQQSVLQRVRREPGHRRGERVGGVRSRDLD